MSNKVIARFKANGNVAVVTYNSTYREYRVRVNDNPDSDYFTEDRKDAEGTAHHMLLSMKKFA